MLLFLALALSQYFGNANDTRDFLFKQFIQLNNKNEVKQFLDNHELSREFVCHIDGEMDRACFDVYVHYFHVILSAPSQDYEMQRLMHWSSIYSKQALLHMIVKSIYDDNPSLFVEAGVLLKPLFSRTEHYTFLLNVELEVFEDAPTWISDFNKLPKQHNLLTFALDRKSIKTFMIIYYYLAFTTNFFVPVDKMGFTYNGVVFKNLFPHLLLSTKGIWLKSYIFKYFCKLSTIALSADKLSISEVVQKFAISYLEHYKFDASNLEHLLSLPNLRDFSTFDYLKRKIRGNVISNYLDFEPPVDLQKYPPNVADVYYRNVDIITDKKWLSHLNRKYKVEGYNDALWKSYRGATYSTCKSTVNCKLILAYCTSSIMCKLVFSSLRSVTEELSNTAYLTLLLKTNKLENTVLALGVIKQMRRNDAAEVIENVKNTFVLTLSETMKVDTETANYILQYRNDLLFDVVDDLNSDHRTVCKSCKYALGSSKFEVLPCSHMYGSRCVNRKRKHVDHQFW